MKKLILWTVPIVVLLLLSVFMWQYFKDRRTLLNYTLNPVWWYRHYSGTDLYDPSYKILYHGNPKVHEVALTIDDGPNPVYGPPTIAVLHKYNVPATFFVVGVRVKQNPELVREMVADGDEIGNHTFDHTRLAPLPPHEIAHELEDDDINIFRAAGVHTTVMRPPGVQYNTKVLRVCKALGYVTVSWNVAAKDYLPVSPDFITDHVLAKIDNGSIILLHQDTPFTVKALPRIITVLRARGYRFVTIDTLLAHLGVQPYAGELHDDAVPTAAPASEPAKFHNTGLGAGGSE